MRKKQIKQLHEEAEEAGIPDRNRLLLIWVNRTIDDTRLSVYNAVRYSWKISPRNAEDVDYVLAVAYGLIIGVFEAEKPWLEATKGNFPEIPERHGNWKRQDGRL
jgi:hypothetical protein